MLRAPEREALFRENIRGPEGSETPMPSHHEEGESLKSTLAGRDRFNKIAFSSKTT